MEKCRQRDSMWSLGYLWSWISECIRCPDNQHSHNFPRPSFPRPWTSIFQWLSRLLFYFFYFFHFWRAFNRWHKGKPPLELFVYFLSRVSFFSTLSFGELRCWKWKIFRMLKVLFKAQKNGFHSIKVLNWALAYCLYSFQGSFGKVWMFALDRRNDFRSLKSKLQRLRIAW